MIIFYDRILLIGFGRIRIYSSLRSPCPTLHSALCTLTVTLPAGRCVGGVRGVWALGSASGRVLRSGEMWGKVYSLIPGSLVQMFLIRCTSSLVRVDRRGRATCVPRRRSSTMTAPAAPRTSPTRATLNTAVPNTCPIYTCHYSSKPAHMTPSALGGSCAVQAAALSSRLSGYRERAIHLTCVTAPSSPVGSVAVEG